MANSTIETQNIIDSLEDLDGSDKMDKEEMERNKTICRLLNIHFRDFFDDIYIPLKFFGNEDWNISRVLYDNEDSLFYHKKFVPKEDEPRFQQVFSKYITMIEEIFSSEHKLQIVLKNWTDMTGYKWKTNGTTSYLRSVLMNKKYRNISPVYITNIFCEYGKKYAQDTEKIKMRLENKLNEIVNNLKIETRIFKKQYHEIVSSYVYEHPGGMDPKCYVLGFINSIIMAILDFAEKLIDLNVYTIHTIIADEIDFYTPLDEVYQYDPSENDDRKLYIV